MSKTWPISWVRSWACWLGESLLVTWINKRNKPISRNHEQTRQNNEIVRTHEAQGTKSAEKQKLTYLIRPVALTLSRKKKQTT